MNTGEESYLRFLSGDIDAIDEIVKEYSDSLIMFLYDITGSFATAEELAQDTFVKLLVKKPKYTKKASFKTWLYTIGRNTAYDYLKKHKKESISFDDISPDMPDGYNLESEFLKSEEKAAVQKALLSLPHDYRQIIHLTYFEGLSNKESAKVMGRSTRAVENLVSRARAALRLKLTEEGFSCENS